jgi:AraC-like DNA-binding protein
MSIPPPATADEADCVLYIKHIVCSRGMRVVRQELESLGLRVQEVRLGAATVAGPASQLDWALIRTTLATAGFALLESPEHALVDRVKQAVGALLRRADTLRHRDFIPTLAQEIGLDSRRLHASFARLAGQESLLSYITRQRLSYAQELLSTSRLDIGRIARQLGYGSLAHFSGQFRRFTQCSPSAYRQQAGAANQLPVVPNDASQRVIDIKPG